MSGVAAARPGSERRATWPMLVAGLAVMVVFVGWWLMARPRPGIVEYPMLAKTDIPAAITAASNGDVWFTMDFSDAIGVFRNGGITRIQKPGQNLEPLGLAVDGAGTVWFTDTQTRSIVGLSPGGTARSFPVSTPIVRFGRLAAASDGSVWFADGASASITRLKDGVFTPYAAGIDGATPYGIAVDGSGNVWATLQEPDKLMRISSRGDVAVFDAPDPNSGFGDVAVDASGAVWFLESRLNRIGRFAENRFTEFAVPTRSAGLTGLAVARNGTVWFTELTAGRIGRIRNGQVREFAVPRTGSHPFNVAADPAHNIWYTDLTGWLGMLPAELAEED